jgi:hypothetical protein
MASGNKDGKPVISISKFEELAPISQRSKSTIMRRLLIVILVVMMPLITPCGIGSDAPVRPASNGLLSSTPLPGGVFNKFFPADEGDFEVVYTQEKNGFSQAKLSRGGQDVAILSVFDTVNNPATLEKFQNSGQTIAGYPAISSGNLGTAILIADQFQVQVRSTDDSFGQPDREEWLSKFNLHGLENLK